MAFLPLIPQSTDALSISQGNILNNFTILGAIAGNGNASSAAINSSSGFNWIFLPSQGSAPGDTPPPAAAFPAGTIGLYSALNPVTGQNDLYINKTNQATVVQVPSTSSSLSINSAPASGSGGWTYLPSGIIMKFGNGVANGNTPFTFAALNPGSPAFTQALSVVLCTAYFTTTDQDKFVWLSSFSNLGFTAFGSARTTVTTKLVGFEYVAIGY
jgi:hypothetical protein